MRVAGWVLVGGGAALAGLLAQSVGLPAGWLVGPMLVAIVAALVWPEHPTVPRWGRLASLAVVGGVLVTSDVGNQYPGGGGFAGEIYNVGYARAMLQAALTNQPRASGSPP